MDDKAANPTARIDFVLEKVGGHIKSFQRSANWYRLVYFCTSVTTLLLSTVVTILAGWNRIASEPPSRFTKEDAILIVGALITIVSGIGLFYSPKGSWLIYAGSLNRLRSLRSEIEFSKQPPVKSDADGKLSAEFHATCQAILDDHNEAWLDLRTATVPAPQTTKVKSTD